MPTERTHQSSKTTDKLIETHAQMEAPHQYDFVAGRQHHDSSPFSLDYTQPEASSSASQGRLHHDDAFSGGSDNLSLRPLRRLLPAPTEEQGSSSHSSDREPFLRDFSLNMIEAGNFKNMSKEDRDAVHKRPFTPEELQIVRGNLKKERDKGRIDTATCKKLCGLAYQQSKQGKETRENIEKSQHRKSQKAKYTLDGTARVQKHL